MPFVAETGISDFLSFFLFGFHDKCDNNKKIKNSRLTKQNERLFLLLIVIITDLL